MLVGFLSLLLAAATFFSIYFGLQSFREYGHFIDQEHAAEVSLEQLQDNIMQQTAYLTALEHDREFQKHVIREKIGYAYPNERILQFVKP